MSVAHIKGPRQITRRLSVRVVDQLGRDSAWDVSAMVRMRLAAAGFDFSTPIASEEVNEHGRRLTVYEQTVEVMASE